MLKKNKFIIFGTNLPHACVILVMALCTFVLVGCASTNGNSHQTQVHPSSQPQSKSKFKNNIDPFESMNRRVSGFNDAIDGAVLQPLAKGYTRVVPSFMRTGVGNFFNNLTNVWTIANSILQLKPKPAAEAWLRLSVNTFFGFGGFLDLASEIGIERPRSDFGQTLARWGVPSGPYLVLPLMGPSTMRDMLASTVISKGDPVWQLDSIPTRNALYGLRLLDKRASLLTTTAFINSVALDNYSFTRDAFLQMRNRTTDPENMEDETPPESEPEIVNQDIDAKVKDTEVIDK